MESVGTRCQWSDWNKWNGLYRCSRGCSKSEMKIYQMMVVEYGEDVFSETDVETSAWDLSSPLR